MLTDTRISNAKAKAKLYKLRDARGMYVAVLPSGVKVFRYDFRLDDRHQTFTIGQYTKSDPIEGITLEQARERLVAARKLVKQGIHPLSSQKAAKTAVEVAKGNSFEAIAKDWMTEGEKTWTDGYAKSVRRALERIAFPAYGALPASEVSPKILRDTLTVLKKPTMARAVLSWSGEVFRYGIGHERCDDDPTQALRGVIKHQTTHHRPMTPEEIPAFLSALEKANCLPLTRIYLKLVLLTFVRKNELLGAKWEEFDFKTGTWRIPAARMKAKRDHIVPLSTQALALLEELTAISGHREFLFPSRNDPRSPMANGSPNALIKRIGFDDFSTHGARSTASTLLNEAGYDPDVIETQLAHKDKNKIRASYNAASYLGERRQLMQVWANIIDDLKNGKQWGVIVDGLKNHGNVLMMRRA